jgi:hypothetical protein
LCFCLASSGPVEQAIDNLRQSLVFFVAITRTPEDFQL